MDKTVLDRLRALDCCALSDAADQLGLTITATGIQPQTVRRRIAGRVVTVLLAGGKAPPGAPARHLCTAAIEAAQRDDIVVVEQKTGVEAAGWGGILSNAAKVRGLAGVIVEGPARDIDEAAELQFPVYARSTTCRTARGRIHEVATGVPVRIGDIQVENGDYVVADSSGTVFIKERDLLRVLEAAERVASRELAMTEAVRAGKPVSAVMGATYEQMLAGK